MSATEDESALLLWERELAGDDGVRTAFVAFDEPGRRVPRRRTRHVTILAVVTAVALFVSGTMASVLGVVVLIIAGLAVVDAHRHERRRVHRWAQST